MSQQFIPQPKIIPPGTQVVTGVEVKGSSGKMIYPKGAVGVVVRVQPQGLYLVRFLDGYEATIPHGDLAIRKHIQREGLKAESQSFSDYIIYRCIVGSRAYGLDEEGSDVDRRGIYLPPAELHWSIYSLPEQLENDETQECYWELQKFLTLALKANPNVLECLHTPLVEFAAPVAQELLNIRAIFLSQLIYQTYNGYVASQFRKLHTHLELYQQIKWKHAMHLIRLLLSGIVILQEGFVPVRVETSQREQLLAIRRGELGWKEVNAWRLSLHKKFDEALLKTHLPERPDYEAANLFLIEARRSMVNQNEDTV
jgi:predicted nucleotidyltransferase